MYTRTDLAWEEKELWEQNADAQTKLHGVWAREYERKGIHITTVKILDEEGARQLHKPIGTYWTFELNALTRHEKYAFVQAVEVLAARLRQMTKGYEQILTVGLGNEQITPDAVGPWVLRNLIVTRHLQQKSEKKISGFRCLSAVQPGVLGATGMESAEMVRGAADRIRPEMILVVDALAAREPSRICSTIQLSDTGIVPGSGVGNSRAAFNQETLGVPVLAIGVPTVMDARSLTEKDGKLCNFHNEISGMMVTPRDVDARVREISRLIGYAINLALHDGLTYEDIPCFLA